MLEEKIENIGDINNFLKTKKLRERIRWAYDNSGGTMLSLVSGGDSSAIIPHAIREAGLTREVPLVFLDIKCYGNSTYRMIKWLEEQKHRVIKILPEEVGLSLEDLSGAEKIKRAKNEMLQYLFSISNPSVITSGIMYWENPDRAKKRIFEWDGFRYRFHPILDFTKDEFEAYSGRYNLPRNLEHVDITKGSCQKKECGINVYPKA